MTEHSAVPQAHVYAYDRWVEATGLPLYRGYYIADTRTLELARWATRDLPTAFVQLVGQEGVSEARISELAPGTSSEPFKMGLDEVVYVLQGRGTASVWAGDSARSTFEWGERAMFILPRHCSHQFHNTSAAVPLRLLHYNYLPLALSLVPDSGIFLDPRENAPASEFLRDPSYYAAERLTYHEDRVTFASYRGVWIGSFFPDMLAWDQFDANIARGAGGSTVSIEFPGSELTCHMSVFPARTYKKAHRHGPGRVIVIPGGEGYSVMWPEGGEKVVVPWQQGSLFVPPTRWFHQHFNLGVSPARYLAFHPPFQLAGYGEKVEDRAKDQIEYPDEDPWIRETFEKQLAKRGLTSLMSEEAYRDRGFRAQTASVV